MTFTPRTTMGGLSHSSPSTRVSYNIAGTPTLFEYVTAIMMATFPRNLVALSGNPHMNLHTDHKGPFQE